jgi:hypothetical protein
MKTNKKKSKYRKKITPTDEYVYHITPSWRYKIIEKSKGLYGSGITTHPVHPENSRKGFLYVVDSPDWGRWNGVYITIVSHNLNDTFVVLGIRKSYLKNEGLTIKKDEYPDPMCGNDYKQIDLGSKVIPHTEIYWVGKYYPDTKRWDNTDKWEYKSKFLGIPPEEIVFCDPTIGRFLGNPIVRYGDRLKYTERKLRKAEDRFGKLMGKKSGWTKCPKVSIKYIGEDVKVEKVD